MLYFTGIWEEDLKILEKYIEKIDYRTPTSRMEKFKIPQKVGGSVLYGWTWRSYLSPTKNREFDEKVGRYKTKIMAERPELWDIFQELRNIYFPGFVFTGVQLNKNYRILPHKDSANIGVSYLVALGDYEGGGRTIVDYKFKVVKLDARAGPVSFDGSKYWHWIENWVKGNRYSLVFFNDKK